MNVTIKRSVSFLLALVMVFSLVPGFGLHAHAEEVGENPAVQYTVRFLDEDGTELQSSLVDGGAMPEYSGEPLYKEGFAFVGWEPEVTAVSADAEYVAVYTEVLPASGEPEIPEVPEDSETPDEPEAPADPEYSDAYLEIQAKIDDMLTWYVGSTQASQAEIEAAVAALDADNLWMAQVEVYDLSVEVEETLTDAEIETLEENNSVLAAFVLELNKYDASANTLIALTGLTDTNIGLDYTKADSSSWSATGTSITGKTSGQYKQNSTTLTITNNLADNCILSFNYTYTIGDTKSGLLNAAGKVTVNGTGYTNSSGSGSVSVTLAKGGTVKVIIVNGTANGTNTTEVKITDIKLASSTQKINTTFAAPDNGSYTLAYGTTTQTVSAGGTAVTTSNEASVEYTLTANPGTGNKFVCWMVGDTAVSTSATYKTKVTADTTIKPLIVPNSTAVFQIGNMYKTDLDDAVAYATAKSIKQIILVSDGTISDTSYEIPAGYTLLIPFDDAHTSYGASPDTAAIPEGQFATVTAKLHRKLTLAENTSITVKGAIEVGAKHWTCHGGATVGGTPVSGYGKIEMGQGSSIVLESNARLYAWGYVTGSGSVIAKPGAAIYEMMNVTDYPGGSFGETIIGEHVFPFNQYYIQNVEVPATIHSGATLICVASVYNRVGAIVGNPGEESSIDFMGGSGSMFALGSETTVTKTYNPATDRMTLDVNGDFSMNAIEIMGENTAEFVLPFNQNLTININSGTSTINQDIMMEPGAQLNVAKDAVLSLPEGKSFYLMDAASWGNFCFAAKTRQAAYVGSRAGAPVARSLTDSKLDVNGALVVDGNIYAASDAVQIISTGQTGAVSFNSAAAGASTVKQCDVTSGSVVAVEVPVDAIYLTHGDKTTLDTANTAAGTTYLYCATHDCWYTGACHYTVSFDSNGGTGTMTDVTVKKGTSYTLPACTFSKEGYDFSGWDLGQVGHTITVTGDTTIKAVWNAKVFTVTWKSGTKILGTTPEVAYGTTVKGLEDVTKESDETNHYTFAGWSLTEGGTKLENLPPITGDTSFYAIFTPEEHDFTNGDCACGAEKPVTNINVIVKGSINYTVDGNVVTVTHTAPCKVGYWDAATSKYVAIKASANVDGSYSFTAPEGVTEVLLVVKGDVDGNGRFLVTDRAKVAKATLKTSHNNYAALAEAWMVFAGDINNNGKIDVIDRANIAKATLKTSHNNYAALTW